ncbi:hypothetical protein D3C87_2150590 [compost metagenome]
MATVPKNAGFHAPACTRSWATALFLALVAPEPSRVGKFARSEKMRRRRSSNVRP